jgi:hypothetical protein
MTSPLPLLAYKRRPRHPLPCHNRSQAFSSSFPLHRVQRKFISLCLPVLSSHWVPVPSLIPDDLDSKILQTFSNRCYPMSHTTYPNITTREDPMRLEHHSQWVMPGVCTHPMCMPVTFLIILLYCEIFLMHWQHRNMFPDVFIISTGEFTDFGHDATRNVIDVQTAAPQPCLLLVPISSDQVISNLPHVVTLVFHLYTIVSEQVLYEFTQQLLGTLISFPQCCPELNPSIPLTASSSFDTSSLPWFYF